MKLKEFVGTMKSPCSMELRDSEDNSICMLISDSKGIIPYLEKEITEWLVYDMSRVRSGELCVYLDLGDSE